MRLALATLTALGIAAAAPALTSGTIGYGSRAGMEVDVVSVPTKARDDVGLTPAAADAADEA